MAYPKLTYAEIEDIWTRYKRIPKNVQYNKTLYYIAASTGKSAASVRRVISAYSAAERGEQPDSGSGSVNEAACRHFGIAAETVAENVTETTDAQSYASALADILRELRDIKTALEGRPRRWRRE